MDQDSDAELAQRAARGDDASFAVLVRRYQNAVFQMACRMLGDRDSGLDAAQDVFLKAHSALASYDEKRRFSTWILSITRNHCIDEIRRPARRKTTALLDGGQASADPGPGPAARVESRQASTIVDEAVQELPEVYREAVMLYHYQELKYTEAAEVQGVPLGTYMARLHRARRMLRDRLRPVLGEGREQ